MAAVKNYPPNTTKRKQATRSKEQCQLCRTKVPLKEQWTVTSDLDNGVAVAKKNAARRGAEKLSHYCKECKEKRMKLRQAWLDRRAKENGSTGAKPKPKAKAKAKSSGKAKTTGKATGKAKTAAKGKATARKAKATGSGKRTGAKTAKQADPF